MSTVLRTILWIVAALCIAALIYVAYMYFAARPAQGTDVSTSISIVNDAQPQPEEAPQPGFTAAASADTGIVNAAPRAPLSGAKEYRSSAYHLSLFYPDTLAVKTYDEGGGAATVTFQNSANAMGFQLFVVPYASSQISKARFLQDEPSGVMQSPLNVTVGGVPATSFYGSNAVLGETAEIWFIRGGYLYEITAPKSEAAWLSDIVNTWRFI
jgi:hypothetical protein